MQEKEERKTERKTERKLKNSRQDLGKCHKLGIQKLFNLDIQDIQMMNLRWMEILNSVPVEESLVAADVAEVCISIFSAAFAAPSAVWTLAPSEVVVAPAP